MCVRSIVSHRGLCSVESLAVWCRAGHWCAAGIRIPGSRKVGAPCSHFRRLLFLCDRPCLSLRFPPLRSHNVSTLYKLNAACLYFVDRVRSMTNRFLARVSAPRGAARGGLPLSPESEPEAESAQNARARSAARSTTWWELAGALVALSPAAALQSDVAPARALVAVAVAAVAAAAAAAAPAALDVTAVAPAPGSTNPAERSRRFLAGVVGRSPGRAGPQNARSDGCARARWCASATGCAARQRATSCGNSRSSSPRRVLVVSRHVPAAACPAVSPAAG